MKNRRTFDSSKQNDMTTVTHNIRINIDNVELVNIETGIKTYVPFYAAEGYRLAAWFANNGVTRENLNCCPDGINLVLETAQNLIYRRKSRKYARERHGIKLNRGIIKGN